MKFNYYMRKDNNLRTIVINIIHIDKKYRVRVLQSYLRPEFETIGFFCKNA